MKKLKILSLNPYHGGAHKAFIDGWLQRSFHEWTLLTLPDSYWKWRLHFAAVEYAHSVNELWQKGQRWDVIFTTSMLNASEFRALTPQLRHIPLVVYFHENQLTYPESDHMKFDLSLCMINIKSALSADEVWFNSDFHKEDFLTAAQKLLESKPSESGHFIQSIIGKSKVHYPGIDERVKEFSVRKSKPVKLVWAARWELDKNPALLFKALRHLKSEGVKFELYFLGEEMHTVLDCIKEGLREFQQEIASFGYLASREDYLEILKSADIFISTAEHEFFGIAALEASLAGCTPILPRHQSYPEIFKEFTDCFYEPRSAKSLSRHIVDCIKTKKVLSINSLEKYLWNHRVEALDRSIADLLS